MVGRLLNSVTRLGINVGLLYHELFVRRALLANCFLSVLGLVYLMFDAIV